MGEGVEGIISEVLLDQWGGTAGTRVQTHRKTKFRLRCVVQLFDCSQTLSAVYMCAYVRDRDT